MSSPGELPIEVLRLLQERIRSIEQLEILLLLREHNDRTWTATEVYQQVKSSERSVAQTLESLLRNELLSFDAATSRYQFAPKTDALRPAIDELAHCYVERRVRVIEAIYSEKTSDVDEFAKAFRIRKDSNG